MSCSEGRAMSLPSPSVPPVTDSYVSKEKILFIMFQILYSYFRDLTTVGRTCLLPLMCDNLVQISARGTIFFPVFSITLDFFLILQKQIFKLCFFFSLIFFQTRFFAVVYNHTRPQRWKSLKMCEWYLSDDLFWRRKLNVEHMSSSAQC